MNGRRPAPVPRVTWIIGAVVALLLVLPIIWHQIHANPLNRLVDLEVYREAGRSIRLGRGVYDFRTPAPQLLPFTYPPFAALLAVPLSLMSFTVAGWVWELSTLALLAWLVAYCFRPAVAEWREWLAARIGIGRAALVTAAVAPLLLPLMMWLEPVRTTFRFGQVNVIIAALVIADCTFTTTRWPRGLLVGLATAIKLTPGLFIPYLWLSGRRRAAYVATAAFVGCQLLAAAAIPGDSKHYWSKALFQSDRLGENNRTANVAIRGVLLRLHPPQPLLTIVLVALVLLVLAVGMSRALLAARGGAELAGVVLVGLTSVAISPVSWDHHLIWLVPALALLLADPARPRRLLAAGAVAALFYTRLPWWSAGILVRTQGVADIWWRTLNVSFSIVTLMLILALPLKSLAELPRSWSRGGFREG